MLLDYLEVGIAFGRGRDTDFCGVESIDNDLYLAQINVEYILNVFNNCSFVGLINIY